MSQSNDPFDLLSSPSPTSQPPALSLHVNMAAPNFASGSSGGAGTFSPNYNIQLTPEIQSTSNQPSLFGKTDQQTSSIFSPTSSQNGSVFGDVSQQPTSLALQSFGQIPGTQSTQQQPASLFGQMQPEQSAQPPNSLFGQNSQQPASGFGQTNQQPVFGQIASAQSPQQPISQFGQMTLAQPTSQSTSPFGQMAGTQPVAQSNSPFGQMVGTQAVAQSNSPFGQMAGTQPVAQSNSPFGQMAGTQAVAQSNSPFGQMAGQQTAQQSNSPFGQQPIPQSNLTFGQMQGGQSAQPSFGVFPNQAPSGINSAQLSNAFPAMTNMPNSTTPQASADPFAMFSSPQSPNSNVNTNAKANNTQQVASDPFAMFSNSASPSPINSTNAQTSNDDFFAAFSTPSNNSQPPQPAPTASIPKNSSSSALDNSFLDAFSQKTTVVAANQPAPAPAVSASVPAVDSAFDPFGLLSAQSPPPPASQQQQPQAAPEPLFDAFSSQAAPVQSLGSETQDNEEEDDESETETETAEKQSGKSSTNRNTADRKEAASTKQEFSDPVLREINDRFGGLWKLLRSDPYDEFLKSMGIGLVHRKRAGKGSPEQCFEVKPDGQIVVSIRSALHSQSNAFRLNEETENLVEKVSQSVFCSYTNGKLFLQMTPSGDAFGRTQEVERFINEHHELVQIHSAGIASCRRYFGKVDGLLLKAATAQTTSDSKTEDSSSTPSTKTVTSTPTPTNQQQAPQSTQPTFQHQVPKSPQIQQKSAASPQPQKPKSPAVVAVDLSTAVTALGVPSPTPVNSPPPASMTPGQLLLQNLHTDCDDDDAFTSSGAQNEAAAQDDANTEKLVFTWGGEPIDEESEA